MIKDGAFIFLRRFWLPLLAVSLWLVALGIGVYKPTIPSDSNFPVAEVVKDHPGHFRSRTSLILEAGASKFFKINTSGCLTQIMVNGAKYVGPPIPFCDSEKGRVFDLSSKLVIGANSLELGGTYSGESPSVSVTMVRAPYLIALRKVLPLMSIALLALWLIEVWVPKILSTRTHRLLTRTTFIALWIVAFVLGFELVGNAPVLSRWGMLLSYGAFVVPLVWAFFPIKVTCAPGYLTSVDRRYLFMLLLMSFSWAIYVSWGTIARHHNFYSHAFDLGIQENLIWNLTYGYGWYSSVMGNIHYLGNHTSFIYLFLLPIYRLFSTTETLLVIQAIVLAVASIPLFYFARRALESDLAAFILAICYLLNPAIQGGAFYDFHELCFSPVLFFSLLYFWISDQKRKLWIAAFLLLLVKEDLSLVLATLGIALAFLGNARIGLQLVVLGIAGYVILQLTIIPLYAGYETSYVHYFDRTISGISSPGELALAILSDPLDISMAAMNSERAKYLFQTLGSNSFVPIFSPASFVTQSYGLFLAIFGGSKALYELGFQYAFNWIPQIFVGSIFVLAHFRKVASRSVLFIVVPSLLIFSLYGMTYPIVRFKGGFYKIDSFTEDREGNVERRAEVKKLQTLPLEEVVVGDELTVPHLARRPVVVPGNRFGGIRGSVSHY